MDHRHVADGDVLADAGRKVVRKVHHGAVLHIRSLPDNNILDVPAQDTGWPDRCQRADLHRANDYGRRGNIGARVDLGTPAKVCLQALFNSHSAHIGLAMFA